MTGASRRNHARQEQVYENLSYNREPWIIRRDLTRTHVAATDRRAIFVGPESPIESRCSTLESRPGRSPYLSTSMTAWAKACGASWGKL